MNGFSADDAVITLTEEGPAFVHEYIVRSSDQCSPEGGRFGLGPYISKRGRESVSLRLSLLLNICSCRSSEYHLFHRIDSTTRIK